MSDLIERAAAIDAVMNTEPVALMDENHQIFTVAQKTEDVVDALKALPSAQPDWTEIMIQCDNCGHMIHAKREDCKVSAQPEPSMEECACCVLIKPERMWIPCSERLPEQYGNYLISIHGEDEPDIGTINPNDKRGWSLCDANGFHWASDKKLIVTAWMPLPEPYRGGGAE